MNALLAKWVCWLEPLAPWADVTPRVPRPHLGLAYFNSSEPESERKARTLDAWLLPAIARAGRADISVGHAALRTRACSARGKQRFDGR